MNLFKTALYAAGCSAVVALVNCDIFNPESGDEAPDVSLSIVSVNSSLDYSEGNTAVYDIDKAKAFANVRTIDSDNNVRTFNGAVYIIERTQCDIIKITGSAISKDNIETEVHIGNATNIHDIAFISATKAYVTQYDATDVVIYNPATGKVTGETISLTDFTPDGASNPNMDAAVYYDGNVYIGLQKYTDDWSLTDNSSVAVIDASTDEVQGEIVLDAKNPQGMCIYNDRLYVACTGSFGAQDGGIEVIDLAAGATDGILVTEAALGGDVSNVIIVNSTTGYAVVADASWTNAVVCFNPTDGNRHGTIAGVENAAQFGLAWDGTYFYVGDRSAANPGLLIVDTSDNSVVSGPHDLGMPPNAIALLEVEE
ncbi:MAG: hypothetical protein JXA18_01970 [Chitinispirillaceae bacterium]|nr:hypothetical protein [Chitinispirillaceae bacterium]